MPSRHLRRRKNEPKAHFAFASEYAVSRRMLAARMAFFGRRPDNRRPPVFLIPGHKLSHEAKCFSVGQALISVPISEIRFSALQPLLKPSSVIRSTPVS